MELDAKDQQILMVLMKNGSISNVDLAAKIGGSEATVRRRLKSMIDEGILEFVPLINPERIGMRTHAIIGMDVDLAHAHNIAEALSDFPQVQFLAHVTGRYNLILTTFFVSEEDLFNFLMNDIPKIPGILRTETLRVMRVAKRNWRFHPNWSHEIEGDLSPSSPNGS